LTAAAALNKSQSEPLSRRLGMKLSLSLDIETPMLSIVPMPHEPKRPVMIHDSRFITQMMDRALPRSSSHPTIEAELAYPPQHTTWTRRRSVEKTI
jgi:hypothetical protein